MDKKELIETEIIKTMDLLEYGEKLPHDSYFFSRLQERMQEQPKKNIVIASLRPILLTCLLALNIITVLSYISTAESSEQIVTNQDPLTTFASDFNLDQNNIFIIE